MAADTEGPAIAAEGLDELPPAIRDIQVGRLTEMAIREVWPMEERHLTPWLAANLDVLEAELGVALELVAREHRVGRYELDLLLRTVDEGRVVIVENQFGSSNHNHLGQLLAYAAGTEADVIIWIAEAFTDEHIAALEWMNAAMGEGAGFFAITLKAVRIGDSLPAPIMETRVRPNEWLKRTVRERNAAQREQQEWDWDKYQHVLSVPPARLEVAQAIVDRIKHALEQRQVQMTQQFRKGYVAFQRTGGYNVILVDVFWSRAPRLIAKIPAPPEELELRSPYPGIHEGYDAGAKDWSFGPITRDRIPDIGLLLDLVLPFHSRNGPMSQPVGGTDAGY